MKFLSEFLAGCDTDGNNCISVAEATACIPEEILDNIPDLGLPDDFEVCADHVEEIMDNYGDLIDEFIAEHFGSKK